MSEEEIKTVQKNGTEEAPFNELSLPVGATTGIDPNINGISNERSLDFIMDIPLKITVELGRTRVPLVSC